jgi:hypothetical protein
VRSNALKKRDSSESAFERTSHLAAGFSGLIIEILIDRIGCAEQQLIAAEYQLTALQLLALQNSELIQLFVVTP